MQQRRLRLGDILDDYCPRERRITNHAVVAMVEDMVKQTRCTTCDADHEYKEAKVPISRRKKRDDAGLPDTTDVSNSMPLLAGTAAEAPEAIEDDVLSAADPFIDAPQPEAAEAAADAEPDELLEDDGPVHRPLIRATLPRPEGQAPERKAPDFTVRQPGGRFDQHRNGQRPPGRHGARQAKGPQGGQPQRFGHRHGAGNGPANDQRQGNRAGGPQGPRGSRPAGPNRGPRQGGGHGRKRGR